MRRTKYQPLTSKWVWGLLALSLSLNVWTGWVTHASAKYLFWETTGIIAKDTGVKLSRKDLLDLLIIDEVRRANGPTNSPGAAAGSTQ